MVRHVQRSKVALKKTPPVGSLYSNCPDNAAHHRHWYGHRRLRAQAIVRTDDNRRVTFGGIHVVFGDNHLTGSYRTAVWARCCYRHRRQIRNVEFLLVPPAVTCSSNIAKWVVE